MAADIVKIKCPQCGTVLKLSAAPNLERKKVMCPKCGFTSMVKEFQQDKGENPSEFHTYIPTPGAGKLNKGSLGEMLPKKDNGTPAPAVRPVVRPTPSPAPKPMKPSSPGTIINPATKIPLVGRLREENGMTHSLKFGLNTVGRNASTSSADIRITDQQSRISREHLVIEVKMPVHVKNQPNMSHTIVGAEIPPIIHTVRLAKQQVNKTYLNDMVMTFGFEYNLKHGDRLALPGNRVLVFVMEDL